MANPTGSIVGPVVGIVGPGPGTEDSAVIVGITTITGGTNTYILFDNNGTLGEQTVATALDTIGAVQGDLLYRNATAWVVLAPGTAGQTLQTGGAGANPSWGAASFTLNSGTNFGITAPGLITLGNTYTIGATTDNLRFADLGLGVAAPTSGGQIAQTLGANNTTAHLIKRFTDSAPTGNFLDFQNAAASSLFTVTIAGVITAGTWQGSVVAEIYGGTNQSTYTLGDTLYASAANTLSKLAGNIASTIKYLAQTGTGAVSAAPAWTTISGGDITGAALTVGNDTNVTLTLGGTPATSLLRAASVTAGWTGQLSLTRGGTAASLTAANGGIVYSTASALAILSATATANQVLLSGSNTTPAWSTATYPATTTASQLLYSSSNNVIAGLSTLNGGLLNTSSSGVPSITITPVLGKAGASTGTLGFSGVTSGVVTIQPASAAGTWSLTLPTTAGTANQVLLTNGSGVTSWADAGTGTVSSIAVSGGTTGLTTSGGPITTSGTITLAGALIIANGGTGATTQQAAFDALAPTSTVAGSITYWNGTHWIKLDGNASGTKVLQEDNTGAPSWVTAGTGTVTSITPSYGIASTITATAPGSAITTSGSIYAARLVNIQTGTTYTVADTDRAKIVTGTNASATAYTLPQAGASSSFQAGWFFDVQNRGAGVITITPTTSTIDGASAITLAKATGARVFSDGTNYFTQTGVSTSRQTTPNRVVKTTGSGTVTLTTTATVLWIEVELIGGGGGGGGGGAAGADGNNTTFGALQGNGGGGGGRGGTAAVGNPGPGGNASGGDVNLTGGSGGGGPTSNILSTTGVGGGGGGSGPFGGGGGSAYNNATAGAANTGGGGGGGGVGTGESSGWGCGGGGAGGYVRKIIGSPSATYAFGVGAGGAGAAASGQEFAGGAGGSGIIIMTEHFGS